MVNYKELYSIISDFISNPKVEMSKGDIYLLIDSLKEELNIILYEYTDFDEQAKVSLDGFTVYDGENYIIFYNTQRKKRIRFTLGHEKIETTLNIYSHLYSESHEYMISVLNKKDGI